MGLFRNRCILGSQNRADLFFSDELSFESLVSQL